MSLIILLSLCMLGCSYGQVLILGGCPEVDVQTDFDLNKYMGRWYELKRYFAIFEFGQKCGTAEYSLREDGVVTVNNTGFNRFGGAYTTSVGDAAVQDMTMPSKLGVRFFPDQPRGNYWVLSTDYTSYSVVWSCDNTGGTGIINSQFLWILSREPGPLPDSTMSAINVMLHKYGLDTDKLRDAVQRDCPGR